MQIETLQIKDLVLYEKNGRTHPKKQIDLLVQNIERFGFTTPCLIDKNNSVIAGHGRIEAMKKLGRDEIPCVRLENLSEEEVKALRIADNKLSEMSEWDMSLVLEELKDLSDEMLDLTGFDKDLILEPDEQDDEVPEVPKEPKSVLGDLYELGGHRVLCGDSTDESVVNRLTQGERLDISFTSPPYNVGFDLQTKKESKYIHSDDISKLDYQDLIVKTTQHSLEYSKDVFVNLQFLAGNKKELLLWLAELANNFKDIFFWKKRSCAPAMAENIANSQVEVIVLFGKDNNSRSWGNKKFRGTFSNHIETNSASGENKNTKIHNATFPVELPFNFLKQGYNENSKVLDLFGGTGTTMIACEKLNMKSYMVELEPLYVDVIVQRYVDYTGNENIKLNGKEIIWKQTEKKPN